tara:strand:+ start:2816 stop:3091 length:276 start_codon:yes stop_codon:yes gene_type:complete
MEIKLCTKVTKIKCCFYQPFLCASNFLNKFASNKQHAMFTFEQYLGFILFLTILTTGFWLMIFLIGFVIPYWLSGNLIEWFKERKKAKQSE